MGYSSRKQQSVIMNKPQFDHSYRENEVRRQQWRNCKKPSNDRRDKDKSCSKHLMAYNSPESSWALQLYKNSGRAQNVPPLKISIAYDCFVRLELIAYFVEIWME